MKRIYNILFAVIIMMLCFSATMAQQTVGRTGREVIFGVTTSNRLISFSSIRPGTISTPIQITGLQAGENILNVDFRPATRTLYAVTNASRVYTINTSTGAATLVGAGPFTPALTATGVALDFNPSPDRIRIVGNDGQNLRVNPDTAVVVSTDASDPKVAYDAMDANAGKTPKIFAAAYTNNFAGVAGAGTAAVPSATTLYTIDSDLDVLVTQGSVNSAPVSPNSGRLFTVGKLGFDVTSTGDMDVSDVSGIAYGAFNLTGENFSRLYTVNLATGAATLVGQIGPMGTETVRAIAVGLTGETVLGATADGKLIAFNAATPNVILASKTINNIKAGDTILGIDYRPATGQIMALGSSGTLYDINPSTGNAVVVGAAATLTGTSFGVDFNPAPDRIRVVSSTGQNLRLNPDNGAVAGTDMPLAYDTGDANSGATPRIVGAAYTNNVAGTGATATTLYEIDAANGNLVIQGSVNATPVSPNAGTLFTIAPLGVKISSNVNGDVFDISGNSGTGYAALTLDGETSSKFFRVALPAATSTTNAATLVGVIGDGTARVTAISVVPQVETIFGLTMAGQLVRFNSRKPDTIIGAPLAITGLQSGETIVGLDFRPVSGILFGLGSTSRVYTINQVTGVATQVGGAPFTPALSGTEFGFDFNPVPDRIRLVSNNGQDLRLNPNNGGLAAMDGTLKFNTGDPNAGATPSIVGSAYTNNFGGTAVTTLYNIDSKLDALVTQGTTPAVTPVISPNDGVQLTVGKLGVDTADAVGFDISESTNRAYAAMQLTGETSSKFFNIDLNTGAATQVGTLPVGGAAPVLLRDVTVNSNVNLSVVAVTSATPIIGGNNFTYTVTVGNGNTDSLANVMLSTSVPANTTFVSTTAPTGFTCQNPAAGASTGAITCTGASLAGLSTASFTITVKAGGTSSGIMAPLMAIVKTDSADISNVRFDNTISSAVATINQPGPAVTAATIKVSNTMIKATATAALPFSGTTVMVNGVAFATAPKLKSNNTILIQKGKLANGMSIKQAIPKGTPVKITFRNSNGGVTDVTFTR